MINLNVKIQRPLLSDDSELGRLYDSVEHYLGESIIEEWLRVFLNILVFHYDRSSTLRDTIQSVVR